MSSEQADSTNALLRSKEVLPPPPDGGDPEKPDEGERPALPKIRLPGKNRDLASFYHELGGVMCKNGVYMRDDIPMVLNKATNRLEPLTSKIFRSYVDRHAWLFGLEFNQMTEQFDEYRKSMSRDIAGDALESFDFKNQQRQIRRVNTVPLPVLRKSGMVELLQSGYDYESQILTMAAKSLEEYELMPIDEARTKAQNFFKHFAFDEKDPATGLCRSFAVHMAAMITPFCLGLLSPKALIPMFIYSANKQGSGKSLLCKSALYTTFGTAAALPFGRDEDELRKQLDTEALEAVPYIFFDNVKRKIASPFLDAWLTQPAWKGRRMGGQREFNVEKQSVVFVSANHAEVDKDANRRALVCKLFLEAADINDRKFDKVLDDEYLDRMPVRRELLSVLWSMVHHWAKLGCPEGPRTLASFEQWSRIVGGIVFAAGFGDPLEPTGDEFDPDSRDMRQLIALLAGYLNPESTDPEDHTFEAEFDAMIELCRNNDFFVQKIDGKKNKDQEFILDRGSRIQMGKLFGRESGQVWPIEGKGKVRFGRKGSKNWRSFHVDLVRNCPGCGALVSYVEACKCGYKTPAK